MNWEAISSIADILAAIGVICSLIYLAIQIRRDSVATTANTTQLRATSVRETFLTVAASESLAEIIAKSSGEPHAGVKFLTDSKELDKAEAVRLNFPG